MGKNMENHQNNTLRYEHKFFVDNIDRNTAQNIIQHHPALFFEIYHERYVNNIYFDDIGFNNFKDNIDGIMYRKKYRIRWYNKMLTIIDKPILELKLKMGLVGSKKYYPLNQFELSKGININKLKGLIGRFKFDSKTKLSMQEQRPVLLNRYRRKYFESRDKRFRITIDDEQSFFKFNTLNNFFLQKHKDSSNIIIELKYDRKYSSEAEHITNMLPFRLTKSSKYARGITLLYC